MRIFVLSIIFIFHFLILNGQNLTNQLDEITKSLTEVVTEKNTYTQQWEYDAENPYQINLRIITVSNKKGDSKTFLYQFNLGDIDKNQVRRKSDKEMKVLLKTLRRQPFIKVFEDGEQQKYESEITLYCNNVDEARALEKLLKEAIPLAKIAWEKAEKLPDNDLLALLNRLQTEVGEVIAGAATIQQEFSFSDKFLDKVKLESEETNSKDKTDTYVREWSFGDIHDPSLTIKVKNEKVFVEGKTRRKLNYVKETANGKLPIFSDGFQFYANDPNQAKILLLILDKLLPLAEKEQKKRLPKINDSTGGLQKMAAQIKSFEVGEDRYDQSLNEACSMEYRQGKYGAKKTEEQDFIFHLGDLNKSATKIKVKKNWIEVTVQTNSKKKFIQVKESEAISYQSGFSFIVSEVESARQLEAALEQTIEHCKQDYQPKSFTWLQEELKKISTESAGKTQKIELIDNDLCQILFQTNSISKRGDLEENYELNLSDINENKIELDVVKNQPVIQLEANNREKIFKYYNSKDKMDYQSSTTVLFPSIEAGKIGVATFKKLIEGCEGN